MEILNPVVHYFGECTKKRSTFGAQLVSSCEIHHLCPQGSKDTKSPAKSAVGDIPTGGTRSIKSMWEKGNVGGSSESPAPANKVRD